MNDNLPPIGHNEPPTNMLAEAHDFDTFSVMLLEAEQLAKVVDAWRGQVVSIEDEQRAAECSDLLDRLGAAKKAVGTAHEQEKRPLLDACHVVDDKYRMIRLMLETAIRPVQSMLGDWIGRLRIKKAHEAVAAKREAERLATVAADTAAKANTIIGELAAQAAESRAQQAARAAQVAAVAKSQAKGTLGGRAKTLRITWHASVTNFPMACRHYANHPEVVAALERIASAEARGGARIIPGFKVYEKETVA